MLFLPAAAHHVAAQRDPPCRLPRRRHPHFRRCVRRHRAVMLPHAFATSDTSAPPRSFFRRSFMPYYYYATSTPSLPPPTTEQHNTVTFCAHDYGGASTRAVQEADAARCAMRVVRVKDAMRACFCRAAA